MFFKNKLTLFVTGVVAPATGAGYALFSSLKPVPVQLKQYFDLVKQSDDLLTNAMKEKKDLDLDKLEGYPKENREGFKIISSIHNSKKGCFIYAKYNNQAEWKPVNKIDDPLEKALLGRAGYSIGKKVLDSICSKEIDSIIWLEQKQSKSNSNWYYWNVYSGLSERRWESWYYQR